LRAITPETYTGLAHDIAQESNTLKALALLIAYAIGAGIPMLLIAYGGQTITSKVRFIAQYASRLQQVFGLILLLLAVAIHFQYDTLLQAKLLEKFPQLNGGVESSILCKIPGYTAQGDECEQRDPLNRNVDTNSKQQILRISNTPNLKNLGPAPEFAGIANWLNTDKPLTLKELKGKVVLVDFWTYSCINCIRTLPYVTKWYDMYHDKGLVVIGVHTPEFPFERETSNVAKAIKQFGIHYPVAQDNEYGTWTVYNNHYWPAEYLIDQNGNIVHTHFGEGEYDQTEMAIKQLLGLSGGATVDSGQNLSGVKSPEMYFGLARQEYLLSGQMHKAGVQDFRLPNRLDTNTFALEGKWDIREDKAVLIQGSGKIKLHFNAAKVHMVLGSSNPNPNGQSVTARVDSYPAKVFMVKDAELYTVFDSGDYGDHVLEVTIPDAGLEAFTFTFG
jgi:thiol-disulfide isomerase/thioredoxin